MEINTRPILKKDDIALLPLEPEDFEALYRVASDPKIWEQHPNKDRWKKEVFQVFFEGALRSNGAFKIVKGREIIGSTRFYDYNLQDDSILIGYTFYGREYWGKGINHSVKSMMLDYIFQFVSKVYFHIGAENIRSQIAISRLGTTKIGEEWVAYFGESSKLNYVYEITKSAWFDQKTKD